MLDLVLGFIRDLWIMIDIYLMSINQLLIQRCGEKKDYTRAVLLCFRNEVITVLYVDKPKVVSLSYLCGISRSTLFRI
jgi:hypothetical protein